MPRATATHSTATPSSARRTVETGRAETTAGIDGCDGIDGLDRIDGCEGSDGFDGACGVGTIGRDGQGEGAAGGSACGFARGATRYDVCGGGA